jgi:tyrosinase
MEGATHNGAHNNSGNSGVSWIGGDPAIAPQDPLFYFLHCNVDRLWAKWQWVNNRFDGAQVTSYDLQGSHNAPAAGVPLPIYTENINGRITQNRTFGQYGDDTLWPWDNVTGGTGTLARPTVAPLTPFPIVPGGLLPGSKPNVKGTIDFRVINFAYDDFTPY